jgi:hypothetical protein
MLVAYVQGDIFLPDLQLGTWNFGETKRCEIASRGTIPPDKRGDLLLCGDKTQLAWSQTWLRGDIKTQIYEAAKTQFVNFHSIGHGGTRGGRVWWQCTKSSAGIDCE